MAIKSAEQPKPRGRPRLDEGRSQVSFSVPTATHDRLIALAKKEDQSLAATVRALLHLRLR